MNNKVAVGICLRPLAKSELDSGAENVIKIHDSKHVILMNDALSTRYGYLVQLHHNIIDDRRLLMQSYITDYNTYKLLIFFL